MCVCVFYIILFHREGGETYKTVLDLLIHSLNSSKQPMLSQVKALSPGHRLIQVREKQEEKEKVFYLLVHSPDDYNGWDWMYPKLGARSFIRVLRMVVQGTSTWTIPRCFPRPWARSWMGNGAVRLELDAQSCQCCVWQLNPLCHSTMPCFTHLI